MTSNNNNSRGLKILKFSGFGLATVGALCVAGAFLSNRFIDNETANNANASFVVGGQASSSTLVVTLDEDALQEIQLKKDEQVKMNGTCIGLGSLLFVAGSVAGIAAVQLEKKQNDFAETL